MRRLSQIVVMLLFAGLRVSAQSPHGDALKIDCSQCHSPAGWTNPTLIWSEKVSGTLKHKGRSRYTEGKVASDSKSVMFSHDSTDFVLEGFHKKVDCRSCHSTMVFDQSPMQCIGCHTDVHNMTLGDDCARCHTPQSWLVNNIPELHEQNGFPLFGSHGNLSCVDCHGGGNASQFDRVGNDCISCHRADFQNTQSPNHVVVGFSTDCIECHDPIGTGWNTNTVDHSFFPLTMGHAITDCNQCHTTGMFSDASPECVSCHLNDFNGTTNPNHVVSGFSTDCATCHTTNVGWTPVAFDHNIYPLIGAHATTSCDACHNGNYTNTPNTCDGCHLPDYN